MEGRPSYEHDLDNLNATELRLGLPGTGQTSEKPKQVASKGSKRSLAEKDEEYCLSKESSLELGSVGSSHFDDEAPPAKAQVVGWPPVRSYRRNHSFQARKRAEAEAAGIYVKVSMDGAPYLRKIDLQVYKKYDELREALEEMFKCFTLREIPRMEGCSNGCDQYAITYEDKDGDLMLVGDVPWEMFISSCKRLRIIRGSEARGLGSNL